jgi:hypothetical protein
MTAMDAMHMGIGIIVGGVLVLLWVLRLRRAQ